MERAALRGIFAPLRSLLHHFAPLTCHYYTIQRKNNQGGAGKFPGNLSVFPFVRVKFRKKIALFALVSPSFYFYNYNFNFFPFSEYKTHLNPSRDAPGFPSPLRPPSSCLVLGMRLRQAASLRLFGTQKQRAERLEVEGE